MQVPLTPLRCFLRAFELYPNRIGVVEGENRYTYAQFTERSQRMAAGLLAAGVKPGDRVAFLSFNTSALLESYFAVPMIGAIIMPLNVRFHHTELKPLLEHSKPRVLFYESEFAPAIETLRSGSPDCVFICTDGPVDNGDQLFSDFIAVDPLPLPDIMSIDETAIAELFYTSGSTGRPKGVALSHRALFLHALSVTSTLDRVENQVVLHTIPLFHSNGWGIPHYGTMLGFRHVMLRRFDPLTVFRLIEQERATMVVMVPTMASALLNSPDRTKFDLSSIQHIMTGGAASSPQLIGQLEAAFPNARVNAGYGLSESGPVATTARPKGTLSFPDEEARRRFSATAGWPAVGVEIRVVNDKGVDVPKDSGTVGEVLIRSNSLMDGYYLEPGLTSEVMKNGWLYSGDMAVWNEELCIHIVDREKDIIISGGENIASIEVEHVLLTHPAVSECAVVAAPHERWGEVPVAIIYRTPGASATQEELIAFAAERLGKFKVPQQVIFHQEPLPKGGTGKIMKFALREPFWVGKERRVQG